MTMNRDQLPAYARRVLELADNDPQLQELMPDPAVEDALRNPELSLEQLIATALEGYAGRPALGERAYEIVVDPSTGRRRREFVPRFETITYFELHSRVKGLANTWRHDERHRVARGDFVCILGFNGTDYATVELACVYAGAVSVPLQSTLAGADLDGILTDTAPTALVATVDDLVVAAQLAGSHDSVRSLIAIDYDEHVDDDRDQFVAAQAELAQTRSAAELTTLDDLIAFGDFQPWEFLPATGRSDERMAVLLHSSGSTGTPKGAIIPERTARRQFAPARLSLPVVRMCFAPMSHLIGRGTVLGTLAQGGTAHFTSKPDLSTLFEDMRLARPTELYIFPRVLEMIHRHYLGEVVRRTEARPGEADAVSAEVMQDMRNTFLGDRASMMIVGSAPTTPELRAFIKDGFQVALHDMYASTEAGATVTVDDRIARPPITDYRLRDVPELGYYTTDKPYPRGELCIKSEFTVPGYFKRPDVTAALYDEDGFLLTGDIMEERGPDHVVYIDRRNDVLKLSQGEFVAIGALGNTFESGSPVIHSVYMYGNSARSHLLAVVVPNMEIAESLLGRDPDAVQLRALIRSELKKVARAANLKSCEVPRDFVVEMEPFSFENGLLSSVRKRLRPALQHKYGGRLEELYDELERKQNAELMALHDASCDLSVLEKVGKALEAALGLEHVDVSQPYSFGELGGDSLGATAFSALLEDIFGVALPVNSILSPAGNAKQWARAIEAELLSGRSATPTFAAVHGEGARQLNAADLDVVRFIDAQTLEHAPLDPPTDVPRTVLLTGATGFLGRFLCLEWLERLATSDGKLICLIRGADQESASRRLDAAFEGADPALRERFRTLAAEHLEVVVGDVAEARLGLTDVEFARLADEVDRIVHPAALVNHVLGYEDLFGPNVAGTAEVIRVALARRQKPIDLVSSVATTLLVDRSAQNDEESPLRQKIALTHGYGAGYATSKWAAEHVLHSAHRRFGLPVNVFRGDMMLAHRTYHGEINVPDVFTRLLYSVIMSGLAPESFYGLQPDGSRATAHYDGLPVDFVAAAIVGISADAHREIRTFHVLNYHADDGLSLDTFVDWIRAAGYAVERVPNHRQWVERFEAKLRALPEDKRQHSSLSVLDSLRHPYNASEPMIGSRRFEHAVRGLSIGPEAPHLTRAFLDKCLDDMRRLGLIPPPDVSPESTGPQPMILATSS
jgi:fatty acid CoA ligase FadD9